MKRFLLHSVILLIAFFVFDKAAYFILLKESNREGDKRLELVFSGKIDAEIIILGSSRAASGINSSLLGKLTNQKTLNMAYRGSHIEFQKLIFDKLLKYNKIPKKLLLVVDNPSEFQDDPSLKFRFDVMYPLAHINEINDILISYEKHQWLSRYLYTLRVHNHQLNFKSSTKKTEFPIDLLGFQPLPLNTDKPTSLEYGMTPSYSSFIGKKSRLTGFYELLAKCKSNNIEIHFLFLPNYEKFNDDFFNEFQQLNDSGFIFMYNQSDYLNPDLFYDRGHLNYVGANKITIDIANYLMNNQETSDKEFTLH